MSLDPIDELYKNSFEHYQAHYNEHAWVQMQKALQPKGPLHLLKTHMFKWYTIVPSAAVVVSAVIATIWIINQNNNKSIILSNENRTTNTLTVDNANKNVNDIPSPSTVKDKEDKTTGAIKAPHITAGNNISSTYHSSDNSAGVNIPVKDQSHSNTGRLINNAIGNTQNSRTVTATTIISTQNNTSASVSSTINKHVNVPTDASAGQGMNMQSANIHLVNNASNENTHTSEVNENQNEVLQSTYLSSLPFSIDSASRNTSVVREYHIYKPMPLPGIVSRYEIELSAGVQNITTNHGYAANNGNEQMASFTALHGHLSYGIGLGRNAFNTQKSFTVDSSYSSVIKVPTSYLIIVVDTHTFWYGHHKFIDTIGYHFHTVHGTKDSTTTTKTTVSKLITGNMRFIEIPLKVGYRFTVQKAFADIQGSVAYLLNQSAAFNYYYTDGSFAHIKPYNAFALSGTLKLGYNISNHIGAFAYGQYRYASTFSPLPIGDKLIWTSWSAGIGLLYKF